MRAVREDDEVAGLPQVGGVDVVGWTVLEQVVERIDIGRGRVLDRQVDVAGRDDELHRLDAGRHSGGGD